MSVAWARTLLDDAVVDALVHDTVDIRAYASVTRHKPRPVKLTHLARDRTCRVPGCARQWHLEADHHHDFALGGLTDSINTGGFCRPHHHEKTHLGARIELTDTEILWWPPRTQPNPSAAHAANTSTPGTSTTSPATTRPTNRTNPTSRDEPDGQLRFG